MLQNATNKKNILLIDDDKSVTQMLSMLLETRGYDVNVANTGEEAFKMASENIDLILLDLVLPDQGGFEVCRKLKESKSTRNTPIIILSARMLSEDIVEGLYLGADDYLTKPFEYEELVARMEAVMRRGSLFRKDIVENGEEAIIYELRKIIDEELITPFFQPIYHIKDSVVYGLEALSRPKTASILNNPEILFKAAIQYGLYQDLEIISWKRALEYISTKLREEKLFLNCNPYLVEGSKFLTIKALFYKSHISVNNVVLEITERSSVSDFNIFYKQLSSFREFGFNFAVDDVGGGYASLESIVVTRPEVVKIDRHIVSDIDKDPLKKSVVKFIVSLCRENNILSIAEGIETREELETIKHLGVDAGQGYYLYKPTNKVDIDHMNKTIKPILK